MTPGEARALVATIAAIWPRPELSDATCAAYGRLLVDLDAGAASAAINLLASSAKFLPSIAEIRSAAADVTHGPVRPGIDAWGDVLEAVEKVGFRQQKDENGWAPSGAPLVTPAFADPVVAQCVETMGGWRAFRDIDASDRKQFVDLYRETAAQRRATIVASPGLQLPPAQEQKRLLTD